MLLYYTDPTKSKFQINFLATYYARACKWHQAQGHGPVALLGTMLLPSLVVE